MRFLRVLLIVIAVVCFGVALSYPIRYRMAQESNNSDMDALSAMRERAQREEGIIPETGEDATAAITTDDENERSDGENAAERSGVQAETEARSNGTAVTMTGEADTPSEGSAATQTREADTPSEETAATQTREAGGEAPSAAIERTEEGMPRRNFAALGDEGYEVAGLPPMTGTSDAGEVSGSAEGHEAGEGSPDDVPQTDPSARDGAVHAPGDAEPVTADLTPGPVPTPEPTPTPESTPTPKPTPTPGIMDLILDGIVTPSPTPEGTPTPVPTATPVPTPTPDRHIHTGALPYPLKDKVVLDKAAMLPELKEIYQLNNDLVGWLVIPGTIIDYPVVQREDSEYYLSHDFYGQENINGQIILDPKCDPYTPSYNLVISGHHMKNGSMFGNLPDYISRSYWESHKFLEFDSLIARQQYIIFACFYSADYDEDEEGFRYNADIRYAKEAEAWLAEVRENQLYDTGIDAEFGDEFITLTTCNRARHRNGRFVVVCRRIREGETFE